MWCAYDRSQAFAGCGIGWELSLSAEKSVVTASEEEKQTLCTIIYYPKEKLSYLRSQGKLTNEFYEKT